MISHINHSYSIGWISNHKFKIQLEKIIKEEQKILENKEHDQHENEKYNKRLIRLLEKEFVGKLNSGLKSRKINEEGYNLLKEDVSLLINNLWTPS